MHVKPYIHWEGAYFTNHSLAIVNREICKRLIDDSLNIGIIPSETDPNFPFDQDLKLLQTRIVTADTPADVTVRHQWPPQWSRPQAGKWVLFQPWEYGALPRQWYIPMRYWTDEVWVPSSYNKNCYVKAGIPEDKVRVIPLGVDTSVFHPNVPELKLDTGKSFKFLFVGGTIFRKGIDILLHAYLAEFNHNDDVSLVIKDFGMNSFYQGITSERSIQACKEDPTAPEIIYLTSELSTKEMAGLYKACDCLVHPYRGEGFGLPIIEAMACGTPVVIPELGAARDFCDYQTSFLIPAVEETYDGQRIGPYDTLGKPWWIKVDPMDLRKVLRFVYEHKQDARQKGLRASKFVAANFTWDHTVAAVKSRIQAIAAKRNNKEDEHAVLERELQRGMDLFTSGSAAQALDAFLCILEAYPHSVQARFNAGVIYTLNTEFSQALTHFQFLTEIMEEQTTSFQGQVWSYLGLCHTRLGHLNDALAALEKGTRLNPDTLTGVVRCYEQLIEKLQKGSGSNSISSEIYHRLGISYLTLGNDLRAKEMFEAALQLDGSRSDLNLQLINDKIAMMKEKHRDVLIGKKIDTPYEIIWQSAILNATGYAEENKSFLTALQSYPVRIQLIPIDDASKMDFTQPSEREFFTQLTKNTLKQPLFHVQSSPASHFTVPRAPISIGRTMFETDSLPSGWLERINHLTDIWVPSHFNKKTFIQSGVDPSRIFIAPGALDFATYNPNRLNPYPLNDRKSFHFLSVFDWNKRKGWDVLLRAYFEEFTLTEDVCLVLKISKYLEPLANPYEEINQLARDLGLSRTPAVHIIDSTLTEEEMIQLYSAVDAFVLPSRGEGWGRPYMESMAMQLPTIGTRWSGNTEFMNDTNSFLINIKGLVPVNPSVPYFGTFQGHKWAEPNESHLRQLMRDVFENYDDARKIGVKARKDLIPSFSRETVASQMFDRLNQLFLRHYA